MDFVTNKTLNSKINKIAKGWNTWDTRSVLRHVILPEAFCIKLGFHQYANLTRQSDSFFGTILVDHVQGTTFTDDISKNDRNKIVIKPGIRTHDGHYTSLELSIRGSTFRIESAHLGDDLVILVTPKLTNERKAPALTLEGKMLWNTPGQVALFEKRIQAKPTKGREINVFCEAAQESDPNLLADYPYLTVPLVQEIGISTGKDRDLIEIKDHVAKVRGNLESSFSKYGELTEVKKAMTTATAWNVIYEPKFKRVVCPVSREWNVRRFGYVLFAWDTFLTGILLAEDHPDLAHICTLEVFREMINDTFVPNCVQGSGRRSWDRSQPPVGALSVLEIYKKTKSKWFLKEAFDPLLKWNRWWDENRRHEFGLLANGSNPFEPLLGDPAELSQPNTALGAKLEAGLDNSPLYDKISFDQETHLSQLIDLGLNSLYIKDCLALLEIAEVCSNNSVCQELEERINKYKKQFKKLWWKEKGIYKDYDVSKNRFAETLIPTIFYPLIPHLLNDREAKFIVDEYLMNPEVFGGQFMLPSLPRSHPEFGKQLYLLGPIWPPLVYLVYLGLLEYPELHDQRKVFVGKAKALLLKNWNLNHFVCENYNSETGLGGLDKHSDPLYSWGALLGLVVLLEKTHNES